MPQFGLSPAAGSLTKLSLCMLPLLPLVLGSALQRGVFAPLAVGAGMPFSFAAIGIAFGALGPALGVDTD